MYLNILTCYLIGGDYDYLLRIAVRNISDYEHLHKNKLSKLFHILRIQPNFTLKEVVRNINLVIE